ncbi:MAG: hypothetical protein LC754_08280, partial [Acidobacteria bacterium]|nr:hypothetical protein [Acidobacteriota bacterium]
GGTIYHVQTEDKGLDTPLILSLVYVGGAILASKRVPYHDLVESGFDEKVLVERLQRQHKLICAAIRSGRIEDLKRMTERDATARGVQQSVKQSENIAPEISVSSNSGVPTSLPTPEVPLTKAPAPQAALVVEQVAPIAIISPAIEEGVGESLPQEIGESAGGAPIPSEELYLHLLDDEGEFRAGQLATIKIHVGRGVYGQQAVADASVTIKVLGTTFRPLLLTTQTDNEGLAVVRALLPRFTSGRAAIIIRATAGDDDAELRRIINQA